MAVKQIKGCTGLQTERKVREMFQRRFPKMKFSEAFGQNQYLKDIDIIAENEMGDVVGTISVKQAFSAKFHDAFSFEIYEEDTREEGSKRESWGLTGEASILCVAYCDEVVTYHYGKLKAYVMDDLNDIPVVTTKRATQRDVAGCGRKFDKAYLKKVPLEVMEKFVLQRFSESFSE